MADFVTSDGIFYRWVPFDTVEKAGDKEQNLGRIRGVVSSEDVDADDEVILQAGLNWTDFIGTETRKGRGFITYEHPLGVMNIVGFPTEIQQQLDASTPFTEIEGCLYLDDKLGKMIFDKARSMKRAGGQRQLGFSIEGRVLPGGRDGKIVKAAKVTSVAISPAPKNPTSLWEPIAASLLSALQEGGPTAFMAKAETMGYPVGGEAAVGVGGLGKLAVQSLQNAPDSLFGIPTKFFRGLTTEDVLVTRILKQLPDVSWDHGRALLEEIRENFNGKRSER